jgi:uncharacterized protein YecE (DUF72 family)
MRFAGRLHLGTSSWYFPGWRNIVWDDAVYREADLARHGLAAYGRHPLLRTVSLDRTFYRGLDVAAYARLAQQVPPGFRFVVKAPAEVTDAVLRSGGTGAAVAPNPHFLDAQRLLDMAVEPASQGLGEAFGVLLLQLSPLPARWLRPLDALLDRLALLWQTVVPALPAGTPLALELRDAAPLQPALTAQLRAHGVRYCIGLHDRMPTLAEQMPALRATGPGDLVCRWNLQRGLRYADAKASWAPFDRLQAPDPDTRQHLAAAVVETLAAGHRAFVTVNNKAEGSGALSVLALAQAIIEADDARKTGQA